MEIQLWRSILCPYELAVRELEVKFNHIIEECKENDIYCPIEQVEGRVKSVSSILEKMQRKGIRDQDLAAIRRELTDIAGVRVICNYLHDIYRIRDLLVAQDDMCLQREKDYIKAPKENGYRGLHLILLVPVFLSAEKELVPVEIQIRTIAMDFWASLEHQLRYKAWHEVPQELHARLKRCSDASAALDLEMQDIFDQLGGTDGMPPQDQEQVQ